MSVHIERAVTDVVAQDESPQKDVSREETPWQRDVRLRASLARHARCLRRTRAEGFDD